MRHVSARAMYDQIEDALASITMQMRSAIQADASMPSRISGNASDAGGPLHRDSGWARQVETELGSVLLSTLGLAATIEWHLHQFRKCTGILCELRVSNAAGFDLPGECAETIFDIYSEALSNVARHAAASRVAIALTISAHQATLAVRDNGIGLGDEATRSSLGGIACMRARAQSQQGMCELAGARNYGTTVRVNLPIARAP